MELKDFVEASLTQILAGTKAAKEKVAETGGDVSPVLWGQPDHFLKQSILQSDKGQCVHMVEFDVAVTATDGTGTKGGVGVVAGVFNLGSAGESRQESSVVSRLKFKVPVVLP